MYVGGVKCPVCGQIDTVRKVTTIVSEGTTSTEQIGIVPDLTGRDFYLLGMRGTGMTEQAQRLAPQPKRPGGIGPRIFLAAAAFLVGGAMACGLSMFVVTPEFGQFACGNWVIGISLVAAALGTIALSGIPGIRQKQALYDRMMEQASMRWSSLYYCNRDDITFNPEQNLVVPVRDLSTYLYAQVFA